MIRTARIFDLFVLLLAVGGSLASLFASPFSLEDGIGFVLFILVFALLSAPLWLALLVLGQHKPRLEKVVLILNQLTAFALACVLVGIMFSPMFSPEKTRAALAFLPLLIVVGIATGLNIAGIHKQRRSARGLVPTKSLQEDGQV